MKELLRREKEDVGLRWTDIIYTLQSTQAIPNVGLRWIDVIYSTLQIYFKAIPGLSKAITD